MDITAKPPPPPPPPPPPAAGPVRGGRLLDWRRPLADLVDLVLIGGAGAATGGLVLAAMEPGTDGMYEALGAFLLALAAGVFAGVVALIALLVVIARRGATPGERAVGIAPGRTVPVAIGHLAVVLATGWGLGGAASQLPEPGLGAIWASAVLAGFAALVILAVHGRGPVAQRAGAVGVAVLIGAALSAVVPDRAPYWHEERPVAEAAMVVVLTEDLGATRACAGRQTVDGSSTGVDPDPCVDPDRRWYVAAPAPEVAASLEEAVAAALGDDAGVRLARGQGQLTVRVGDFTTALVRARPDCSTEVILDGYEVPLPLEQQPVCG